MEAPSGVGPSCELETSSTVGMTGRPGRAMSPLTRSTVFSDFSFQPQVSITGGAIVGVEALARWRHPEHGELGAETLFGIAERSDYLAQLSDHVHRRAIAAAADWPTALSELRLAVNITAADIVQ